jgi:pimeloyl-ACP methyl ester carboxylesterase
MVPMASTIIMPFASDARLAIDESGDPHGLPVFFFHGWPASRLQGSGFSIEARELGIRILAPDRPGIGLSSYQPGRRLLDWPPVVVQMAQHFGIERFRLLAVSGGGPYALATAFAFPERVETVAIVSGAPPLGPDVDRRALLPVYRWLLAAYRMRPGVLRHLFRLVRPVATLRPPSWSWPLLLRFVPAADRNALLDRAVFEGSFACYREAWRGTAEGVVSDAEVYAREWGFAPEEVRSPVQLWHGRNDRSFSWQLAAELARRLPHCETHWLENEGHYSLPIRHRRAILEALIRPSPAVPVVEADDEPVNEIARRSN